MSNPRIEAEKLLEKMGLTKPPFDPEFIAEENGVDVKFVNFRNGAANLVHGYYDHAESAIFVNAEDTPVEMQFTIAHELGHHVLHKEHSAGAGYVPRLKTHVDTKEEREADEFAKNLLAPRMVVSGYASKLDVGELASIFLVSPDMISDVLNDCDQDE